MKKNGKTRRRILKKILFTLIVLLLLAAAGFYGYTLLKQEYTVTYDSYTATTGSISNALSFSGNLSLVDSKVYTAESSATVRTLYVAAGDQVAAGDKLARLSNGETVSAEFDGRVNAVSVAEGDEVTAGASLVQVADFEHMKVTLRVDEYDIADVSVGERCVVTATATEKSFESEIAGIDYISTSGSSVAYYSAVAYVTVDDGVYPGMQVSVSIPQQEATDVVILKADAISFDETNQAFVWKKDSAGELEQVMIETGVSNGNYVEIVSGLSDGDEVFVESEEEADSALTGLLFSLFGSRQFNGGAGSGFSGGSGGFSGGKPSGASGSGAPSGESQSFRVTPGEALTSSHASGDRDMQLYGAVEVAAAEEPMEVLTLGGVELAVSLDGQARFFAVAEGDCLTLTPEAEGEAWRVNAFALKTLNRSGVDLLRLRIGDGAVEIPTDWSPQGAEYARLCAEGYVSKDYELRVALSGVEVLVAGESYRLNQDNELVGG